MVATTNAVAKVAAVVAGLGLVAMSFAFAPAKAAMTADEIAAQIAALQAQLASLGGSSSSSTTFTMDLTIGSTGSEVTALQNWLISKGYSIPAGATGYFGTQTQAAVAAFQTANGITPAAGYFGPITRAKVNATGGSTGSTGSTGGLSGGEADLKSFDLMAGDDLMEGDSDTEIAIAKFDVKGGDAEVQRVTLDFQPVLSSGSANEHPWEYVDTLSVYDGSKKVGEVDAGSKSDWDKEDDDNAHSGSLSYYTIDIPVKDVVSEGDTVELSIRADAQSTIDTGDQDQTFKVQVPEDGIRAVDAKGIQQYTGDGEEITLGFDPAENGDLTVKKSSDTPLAGTIVADDTNTSDEFDVLKFQIKNSDNADATLTDLTVSVATSSSLTGDTNAGDITDIIRSATITVDGTDYDGDIQTDNTIDFTDMDVDLPGDDTVDFTVSIKLFGQSGHYASTGHTLLFSVSSGNVTAEGADNGDASSVSGTATGYTQSVAVNGGITIEGNTMSASLVPNDTVTSSYGTFTLKFDVTANGDDVYIPRTIGVTANTANQTASTTHKIGVEVKTAMSASTTSSNTTTTLTTTADVQNTYFYVVHDGDTETFTATVTINPVGTTADLGTFQVGLDKVYFSSTETDLNSLQSIDVDEDNSDFHTDPLAIQG